LNVFDLDRALITDYERFARSFTRIRAPDLRRQIEDIYASRRFWPEPLLSINPHFEPGDDIADLVASGTLHPDTARIFRIDGKTIRLHRHQSQAVAKAKARQSFVVTTGTGSGKSLCFFVPILDDAVRARAAREPPRTRAIVVYPMNALANSQIKELEKFIEQSGLEAGARPTFARYTGQESEEERERIRRQRPDILLTNFMMLELLMTRQDELDRNVIANAEGLDFLVLDELHTYRGRQGADVAMLVRRVRDRLCRDKTPVCIGTSATMASEGAEQEKATAVAAVASRLFGTPVAPDAVIVESLARATGGSLRDAAMRAALADSIDADIGNDLDDETLKRHALAVWIELELGLEDGQRLERRQPTTIEEAAIRLAQSTGKPADRCRQQLEAMLILMSRPAHERGGKGERAFLAFKLHRFLSGAGFAYATLRPPGERRIGLDGQKFDPEDPHARLYPTFFCRGCGQEFHSVTLKDEAGRRCALPRPIDEPPLEDAEDEEAGYLMPEPVGDAEYDFKGAIENYPEEWIEHSPKGPRIKSSLRKHIPRSATVDMDGEMNGTGTAVWFLPGKFRFCPACGHQPPGQAREINKLASLSAEGRSSATTVLISSVLRWMNRQGTGVPVDKRKLLSFTDNRQDAALQAGHFNDFLFISLLRAAVLAAVRGAGQEGLGEEEFGRRVQQALGFTDGNENRRAEWMLNPKAVGVGRVDASRALTRVLAYRVWADQRRGWRFTNPSLEELGLVSAQYVGLDELANDDTAFAAAPSELRGLAPEKRKRVLSLLCDALRSGLAITAESLDRDVLETVGLASRQHLAEPWAIPQHEKLRTASALILDAPRRDAMGLRDEALMIRGGPRSGLARRLNRRKIWGRKLSPDKYLEVLRALLTAAERDYKLVQTVPTVFDVPGWRLNAGVVRLVSNPEAADRARANPYFINLYETLATALGQGGQGVFGFEGREHTAQVDHDRRKWREWRFRFGQDDQAQLASARQDMQLAGEPGDFLPVLFCSPTMELGVDISALNAVYLRNVPPTPANYAQRSGRAGRSGQAALVVAYCAAQSPHDQYYFARPSQMVSGIVLPPALDLANRDLVEAHLHAVWLAEAGAVLASDIPHVLDLGSEALPVRSDLKEVLTHRDLAQRAAGSMERILAAIEPDLAAADPEWARDRRAFAAETAAAAWRRFAHAFDRWRQLYQSARSQLVEANRRSEQHGLSSKERKDAKSQQAQANEQLALLERGTASSGSDFYTYRYLATEGFLPGYNFPRLPLYAFIPAVGLGAGKAAFLQRARFLAIAEFGPFSLVYHEGRSFRVYKAKLPPGLLTETGRLATTTLYVCDACGAAHSAEPERCHACGAGMGEVHPIHNILRIDNVETKPTERITANDEERQRQGYEIQTVFAWPTRAGRVDIVSGIAEDPEGPVLRLDYGAGATISRINKGLRRRAEKSILGFKINPANGSWTGKSVEGEEEDAADDSIAQRVVPIVQDNKNAALLRVSEAVTETAMTTLQHAIARGIEVAFQLEEGETLTGPVPSRDNRRAILAFEATEGGAGVLGRLVNEPEALSRVAREALKLIHCKDIDRAIAAGDPGLLVDEPGSGCVKGCYRCLLSYYNQPDHELIDRTDGAARRILLRLARGQVRPVAASKVSGAWSQALESWGLPAPDADSLKLDGIGIPLVWREHLVAAVPHPLTDEQRSEIEQRGYSVVVVPETPGPKAPPELAVLLARQP
jgi:Lhr-like helicase